ncbi:MAG: ribonuclease HII [Deltaproteobacteria bacterium]|nr:MAG: ribonuclease HII [Deltaproteobacteria bacterium]
MHLGHPVIPDQASEEKSLSAQGYRRIAGVDEAGRGPLAGPVVAAAVIIAPEDRIPGVRDSKMLTPTQREELYQIITSRAISWGVGLVGPRDIERHNILQATIRAMKEAVLRLDPLPDFLLIDGTCSIPIDIPQRSLKKGDNLCPSVSAASILAKVTRDTLMLEYHRLYPQYNFVRHKGYPTREHREAIRKYGCCEIHRRTFKGVKEFIRGYEWEIRGRFWGGGEKT